MKITKVAFEHLDAVAAIENACFSLPWTRGQLERQMLAENCVFLAAVDENGTVLGYIGLMTVLDEGYISNVAVAPAYRRRGVADALIGALVAHVRDRLSFLTLEVRESNLAAIRLYEKHGFTPVGRRKAYYDRPREDALLMTLFLKKEELSC
jgi:ribosomal-protein-alanine N-acetyltransferase